MASKRGFSRATLEGRCSKKNMDGRRSLGEREAITALFDSPKKEYRFRAIRRGLAYPRGLNGKLDDGQRRGDQAPRTSAPIQAL